MTLDFRWRCSAASLIFQTAGYWSSECLMVYTLKRNMSRDHHSNVLALAVFHWDHKVNSWLFSTENALCGYFSFLRCRCGIFQNRIGHKGIIKREQKIYSWKVFTQRQTKESLEKKALRAKIFQYFNRWKMQLEQL